MIERNRPCLEITKTTGWEARDRPDDALDSFASVVQWSLDQGTLDARRARRLRSLEIGRAHV